MVTIDRAELNERRRVEEALRESEQRYRLLFTQAPICIAITDVDGRFIIANQAAADLVHAPGPDAVLGHTVWDFIHPDSQELIRENFKKSIETLEPVICVEHKLIRFDGTIAYAECYVIPFYERGTLRLQIVVPDLTQRKESELELQAREQAYRTLAENLPGLVYRIHCKDEHRIQCFNRWCSDFVGAESEALPPSEVCLFEKLIVEEERVAVWDRIEQAIQESRPYLVEYHLRRADDEIRYMQERGTPVKDGDTLSHIDAVVFDITDNERTRRALVESEERNRLMLHSTAEGIYGVDLAGNCTFVNPAALRTLGYENEKALLGKNMHTTIHHTRADGSRYPHRECRVYQAFRRGEGVYVDDEVLWRADGTSFPAEYRAAPLFPNGIPVGAVVTFVDVTERKQAEQKQLRTAERLRVLNEIDKAVQLAKSTVDIANAAIDHICRLVPAVWMVVTEFDPTSKQAIVLASKGIGQSTAGRGMRLSVANLVENRTVLHQGETVAVDNLFVVPKHPPLIQSLMTEGLCSYVTVPLIAEEELIGTLTLGADCTPLPAENVEIAQEVATSLAVAIQQRRLHEQVERHAEELEQRVAERTAEVIAANRELESFSYSVSHDLRTPLRSINGFSQALFEDYYDALDEHGRHYLERIRATTRDMGELIDDLLTLGRVTRTEISRETVDLSVMARETIEVLRRGDPGRRAEITIQNGADARGDPQLLRIVLDNLLDNAWKFTGPKDCARIEFGFRDSQNERIFYVRDNGVGFDMRYVDKLFQPFQRLHPPQAFGGTGIGLATVKRIVERHGGRAWAEAEVDRGATVSFALSK